MEGLPSSVELGFGLILGKLGDTLVLLLPDSLSSRFTLQWETAVCLPVFSSLAGLLFTFRLVQSVRSRLYVRREKQLAETLAAPIGKKCQLTDKLCAAKKECAGMETSLGNVIKYTQPHWHRKLRRVNLILREELKSLVQELIKERFAQSKQEEMEEMLKVLKSLEAVVRITTSRGAFPNQPGGQAPSPDGLFPRSGPGY